MEPDQDAKTDKIKEKFISTSGPVPPLPTPNTRPIVDEDEEDEEEDSSSTPSPKPKSKIKSIFAQRMAQKAEHKRPGISSSRSEADIASRDKMAKEIQALMQNIGVISANDTITSEDIIKMRENIMRSMNKSNVEFLKTKGSKKGPQKVKTDMKDKSEPGSNPKVAKKEFEGKSQTGRKAGRGLPLKLDEVKNIPHMDSLELPKLEWTVDPGKQKEKQPPAVPTDIQARFDLEGNLIDPQTVSDQTWVQGLHHHGEEMDKPGYTFEELLIYARSTNVSQRGLALNALAGIFRNAHEGVYDSALSVNPLGLLMNVDVITVIRKSIDFEDMVTLDAAFACLSAVMFPTTEEECYDVVYLFPNANPFLWHKVLSVDRDVVRDPSTRDHQILTMDLLLFLVERSHLLNRIEYLLVERPERVSEAVEINILRVLIRVARHSPDALVKSSGILNYVCSNISTSNWTAVSAASKKPELDSDLVTNNPLAITIWLGMKLLRVIVESSFENADIVHSQYTIMSAVLTFLATDYRYGLQSTSHAKLIILESFRFWSSSLALGFGINEFNTIFPIFALNLRHFCDADALKNIVGFDGYYLAYVFHFLHSVLVCGERGFQGIRTVQNAWMMVKDMEFFVLTITMNVLQILAQSVEDWSLAVAGKGVEFLTTALKLGQLEHRRTAIVDSVKHLDFSHVAHSLQQHSIILNMSKIRSRYPSNYISSSAILTSTKVNYVVAKKSPFQFYKPWIQFLKQLGCVDTIFNVGINDYVEILTETHPLEYFETHYIRFEQLFIHSLLTCMDTSRVPLNVLLHLVCTLSKSDVVLFHEFIKLMVDKLEDDGTGCKDEVIRLYMSCFYPGVNLQSMELPADDSMDFTLDSFLPTGKMLFQPMGIALVHGKFWMFEPLQKLAKRYSQNPTDLKKNLPLVIKETRVCLLFVEHLLAQPSIISTGSDVISCYILITQIFTMGEEVFLEPSIQCLLESILRTMVALLEKNLNKDTKPFTNFKPGPGFEHISTFQDFYAELLKEFESVSYCSNIFSAYLLLPLLPTEAREIKLLFWSMQGLQFVRLELNNNLIPPDFLTREVETDRALLQLYTILLVKTSTINRNNNELLFHVLDFHVTRGLPVEDMQKVMKLM